MRASRRQFLGSGLLAGASAFLLAPSAFGEEPTPDTPRPRPAARRAKPIAPKPAPPPPPPHSAVTADPKLTDLTADQALILLKEGNRNFVADQPQPMALTSNRRREIADTQHPFAAILSCSDSRVPPELIFGRGLGELFVVRNAGNTIDPVVMGSLEYAVSHLNVPLIVVLGHERCGAVGAAMAVARENSRFPGNIGQVTEPILPSVLRAQRQGGDLFEATVKENVRTMVATLRNAADDDQVRQVVSRLRDDIDPQSHGAFGDRKLRVVGAFYDLDTGMVDFFDQ